MKRILVLCAAMALFATSAFAVGADLSAVACPSGAGASADGGTLDCANSGVLTMYIVFQPGESAPDLTGIDVVLDLQVNGDLNSDASFWDFELVNVAALAVSHTRPSTICNAYTNSWQPAGSGEGALASRSGVQVERIKALAYRPTPLAYVTNQKLFGMSVTIDGSQSAEGGGNAAAVGCSKPTCFVLNNVFPRLVSGTPTMDLSGPSSFGNTVTVNGATAAQCLVVPTKKHTWGQLKSLYR